MERLIEEMFNVPKLKELVEYAHEFYHPKAKSTEQKNQCLKGQEQKDHIFVYESSVCFLSVA